MTKLRGTSWGNSDKLTRASRSLKTETKNLAKRTTAKQALAAEVKAIDGLQQQSDRLKAALKAMRDGRLTNLAPLLPLLFSLKGDPYHLRDHFPFEPVFNTHMPQRLTLKAGRQVSKSTSMAAFGVLQSWTLPYFNTLFVTPLFEMIRRFSSNYVRGFIEQSPLRGMYIDSTCNNSVLQRSFVNQSTMFFSYMSLTADRVRGINADKLVIDECQDVDADLVPVAQETMSGSKWGISAFTGTPKTLDGFLEASWMRSSQAQWHIWCKACGYENIPSLEYDLDAMTGPSVVTREISEASPGVVCAKCSRPIFPREGRWVHHYPERRQLAAGLHIPQIIMPMHYANKVKWNILLGKREGLEEYLYYNEVCGESYDVGAKLVTQTELQRACRNRPNSKEYAQSHVGDYVHRIVSVDWGGQGQDEISYTVMSCMGLTADGHVDVVWSHRFRSLHNYSQEVLGIMDAIRAFKAQAVVHDFGGAGAVREHYMVTAGVPLNMISPISYVRASVGPIMKHKPPNENTGQRAYYQVDKARSLVLTCELIRQQQIRFFEYDFVSPDQPGLIHDFLALVEDNVESRTGMDVFTVIRSAQAGPDDFAQSVNMGACGLFHMANHWPDLAVLANIKLDAATIEQMSPSVPDWDAI